MTDAAKRLEFRTLVEKHAKDDGFLATAIKDFYIYRATTPQKKSRQLYDAGIIIMASGEKRCHLNGQSYDYGVGTYLGSFLPVPLEAEEVKASPEEPILLVALKMDLSRIAEMLLKLDRLVPPSDKAPDSMGIFTSPLKDDLLEPVIRLLRTLDNPADVAMLSEGIIEEIYYRVLTDDHVGAIRNLLEQHGQIQQISRAVEHIYKNISKPVHIEELAAKANMSLSHFHKNFKDVMQMPPLQYAKSIKLFRAQSLIQAGEKASQAGYAVGYNSAAQFSREYKRQFGYAPSTTA